MVDLCVLLAHRGAKADTPDALATDSISGQHIMECSGEKCGQPNEPSIRNPCSTPSAHWVLHFPGAIYQGRIRIAQENRPIRAPLSGSWAPYGGSYDMGNGEEGFWATLPKSRPTHRPARRPLFNPNLGYLYHISGVIYTRVLREWQIDQIRPILSRDYGLDGESGKLRMGAHDFWMTLSQLMAIHRVSLCNPNRG